MPRPPEGAEPEQGEIADAVLGNADEALGSDDAGRGSADAMLTNADAERGIADAVLRGAAAASGKEYAVLGSADAVLDSDDAGLGSADAAIGIAVAERGSADAALGEADATPRKDDAGLGSADAALRGSSADTLASLRQCMAHRAHEWLVGRHGADFIKGVSLDMVGDGSMQVVIHLCRDKRKRKRWKEVAAESSNHSELASLLGGVHFEFFGIFDS